MDHSYPIIQVCTENMTDAGIENDTIMQQRLCALNMQYFLICVQDTFKTFLNSWKAVQERISDHH